MLALQKKKQMIEILVVALVVNLTLAV